MFWRHPDFLSPRDAPLGDSLRLMGRMYGVKSALAKTYLLQKCELWAAKRPAAGQEEGVAGAASTQARLCNAVRNATGAMELMKHYESV